MKENLIFLIFFAVCAGGAVAQESDSLEVAVTKIETSEIVIEKDTVQSSGLGEPIFKKEEKEEVNEDKKRPRIIYYEGGAQTEDKRYRSHHSSDIKTLSGSMNHSGGFGAISFRYSDFRGETIVMAGMRGGWIVNRTLGIGFEGHGLIPTAKFSDIDANRDVVLLGGYGGMFLELIFFSNQVIHVTFPVSAGAGWLGYNQDWESDLSNPQPYGPSNNPLVDDDTFWYVEPGANLELNVSRNFRMCFGVSKRFTQDLTLVNSGTDAFDNINFFLTLKFGRF